MESNSIKKDIIEYLKVLNFFSKRFDINSYISSKGINNEEELLRMYEDLKKETNKVLIAKCNDTFKYLINSISSLIRNKNIKEKEKLYTLNIIMDKISRIPEIKDDPYIALYKNVYIRPFLIVSYNGNKEEFLSNYPSLAEFANIYELKRSEKEQIKYDIKEENLAYYQINNELIERYRSGDEEAKRELVNENKKLISDIAYSYFIRNKKYSFEELFNEGVLGLLIAVDKFNPLIGENFTTYARYWIRQRITSYVKGNYRIVSLPNNKVDFIMEVKGRLAVIESEYGSGLPTSRKIELLGITQKEYDEYLMYADDAMSLDSRTSTARHDEDTSLSVANMVPSKTNVEKEIVEKVSEEQFLARIKEVLTEKQFKVVYMRFGFGGTGEKKQEAIAKELNLTKQRVNQIEFDALEIIKYLLEGNEKELNKLIKKKENKKKPNEKKKRKILSWFDPLV